MNNVKHYCINCKWFERGFLALFLEMKNKKCYHRSSRLPTGDYNFASINRLYNDFSCGPDARFYEE